MLTNLFHNDLSLFPPEITVQHGRICGPLPEDAPIIVSNGVGVDSVAMLVALRRLDIMPDAIATALVGRGEFGNEHRRFYDYLPVLEQWLDDTGFPAISYVWYEMQRPARHFAYWSLAGIPVYTGTANRTLPSISFRRNHSCSLKFKGAEIDRWVTAQYGQRPLRQAQCRPCYRLVGYDLSEAYRAARFTTKTKRDGPRSRDVYVYPLQLLRLDRADCEAAIAAAGLPSPGLSACVFCAAMHPEEIDDLRPEEMWLIVILEAHAQINLKKIRGLWGHGERMTEYILRRELLPPDLVAEVWTKWSAVERPSELRDNPEAVADMVLFAEVRRLAALCG
ncbi:MAG TPA: hypothetical protein PLK31_02030 [Chloroflexota bacterium]|nr:hypothetical protein [Chloroflexota bacterium]